MNLLSRALRALVGVACAATIAVAPTAAGAVDPYQIYSFSSLTGSLAFVGKAGSDALRAYEDYFNKNGGLNGRPIHFVIQDTETNPQLALQLVTRQLGAHPALILGPTAAAECNAVFALTKSAGPVTWCYSSAVSAQPGSFDFQTSATNYDYNTAAIRWLRSRGLTKIALITPTDATGQTYDQAIEAILRLPENASVRLVAHEHFNPTDVTVDAQVSSVRGAGAQVLIVGTAGSAAGTVFHALSNVGLNIPVVTGNGNASQAFMKQYAAFLPKQLYVESTHCLAPGAISDKAEKDAYAAYASAMQASGVAVDCLQSLAWDPALILTSALRRLGPNATPDQLRAYLDNLHAFAGVNGTYDFKRVPQRGLDDRAVVIIRWDEAKGSWIPASKPGGVPL
jgi:branched-chain amino acid transport system substrate-binding protein